MRSFYLGFLCVYLSYLFTNVKAAPQTCAVDNSNKVDCGFAGINEGSCLAKGCCWYPEGSGSLQPWCYYKGSNSGYALSELIPTTYGFTANLTLMGKTSSDFGDDIETLKLDIIYETASILHIRINNKQESRYEIPQSIISRSTATEVRKAIETLYSFEYTTNPFTFQVIRNADGVNIFNNKDSLVFKDQFIELSTNYNPSAKTFGLGESARENQALYANEVYTLWNTDIASAVFDVNLYGSFPYYLQVVNGTAYGVLLLNSNGMDVMLRDDSLTFTVIGGMLDLYFFVGPTPTDVIDQYTSIVGRPAMVPYFSLGFHNCKYGYTSLQQVKDVVKNYYNAKIPLQTQWMDIDYMDGFRDFTVDEVNFILQDTRDFVNQLHEQGQNFVPIVDPGIKIDKGYNAYDTGIASNIFVKDLQGTNYVSQVWPGPTYFPDFFNPNGNTYWTNQLRGFYGYLAYDGLWIDMNEASNFCNSNGRAQVCYTNDNCPNPSQQTTCCLTCYTVDTSNKWDFPPYNIQAYYGLISSKTIAMSAVQYGNNLVYNTHNLYGLSEQIATYNALTQIRFKRPFIISRSSFVGTGKWSGKWTGDNGATWEDLKASIVGIMDFNMFGIPMIGADICGFLYDTTEELCARWIEVGAFYPFSRDHNTLGAKPQELYLWETVTEAAINALTMKYRLIPYYYTLFYLAHVSGRTVVRSLWINFPSDATTLTINTQFMIGSAILITPVLESGKTLVTGYFPAGNWYDFKSQSFAFSSSSGEYRTLSTPLTSVNVHFYGGNVLAMQDYKMTIDEMRSTPLTILCGLDTAGKATGSFYWDDGEQIDLLAYLYSIYTVVTSISGGNFKADIQSNPFLAGSDVNVGGIIIMGSPDSSLALPSQVMFYDQVLPSSSYLFDPINRILTFTNLNIQANTPVSLVWTY